jgi:hypothetical protein
MDEMNWLTVATSVVGSSALVSALVFLLRSWISERLKGAIQAEYAAKLETLRAQLKGDADMRLEVHKASLKAAGDVELERQRSQLAATAAERNTLLNALTTRRFEAIAAIHAALLKFHIALGRLTAAFRPVGVDEQALLKDVADASEAFDKVLSEKQIFLSQRTEAKIVEIRQMLVSNANLFQWTVAMNQHNPERPLKWMEIEQTVRGPVTHAIGDLAAELRALMGDKPAA